MRHRNWLMTKNYKNNDILSNEALIEIIMESKDVKYYVFQLEQGNFENTKHHQLFITFHNAKEHQYMINHFPGCHIKEVINTPYSAAQYCKKEETRLTEPVEWGTPPQQGKRKDLEIMYEMVKDGATNEELRERFTNTYMKFFRNIEHIRQQIKYEEFLEVFRKLQVTYIYGNPGTGKSKSVIDEHGYRNVYRITDKRHPFDMYEGQDVIVFEEFRSTFLFDEMLNYLDGYPLILPARYNQKVACYTKVYVITNIPLEKQYEKKQEDNLESYQAFCRRIHQVKRYTYTNKSKGEVLIETFGSPYDYFKKIKLAEYLERSEQLFTSRHHEHEFVLPPIEMSWFDDEDYLDYYGNKEHHTYIHGKNITLVMPSSNQEIESSILDDLLK